MKTRQVGTNGLKVSEIGFGCMGLNSTYSHSLANEESIALIRSAVHLGVTFFDTAEIYGPFTNEEFVGEALRNVRDQVTIATQVSALTETDLLAMITRAFSMRFLWSEFLDFCT